MTCTTATESSTGEYKFRKEHFRVRITVGGAIIAVSRKDILESAITADLKAQPLEAGEPAPSVGAIKAAKDLVLANAERIPTPDVSLFFGEVQFTWRRGQKEVTLLSQDGSAPKIQYYEWRDQGSQSRIEENVNANDLAAAIDWLR